MLNYVRLPLLFFFLASLIGVFLRWQFVWPTLGVTYTYFLHGHSHTMFLGWVFNALYIAYTTAHIPSAKQRIFRITFVAIQFLVVAMMISFPIQGYGLFSITFSTLHTLLVIFFIIIYFRHTKNIKSVYGWFARVSLLFFAASTVGPFSLGYLMANGMGQSNLYYFSIYYYLHFQYNGFFLFGILGLFFHLLDIRQIPYDSQRAKSIGLWMAVACVPAYLLSVLWAKPGVFFNIVGGLAALIQVYALGLLLLFIKTTNPIQKLTLKSSRLLLSIALLALIVKTILQVLSAFPTVAALAYSLKPVVIAYLHLVLIGIISCGLLVWYSEMHWVKDKSLYKITITFLASFIISEVILILQPWWSSLKHLIPWNSSQLIFIFSVIMSYCCYLFFHFSKTPSLTDKNQNAV